MPFPVAHSLLGASVIFAGQKGRIVIGDRSTWRSLIWGVLLGNLPDLDFIGVWFFHMGAYWHRGFSHSIAVAAIVGVACGLAAPQGTRLRWGIVSGAAVASHGILDALVSVKSGCELFWPVLSQRIAFGVVEYPDTLDISYSRSIDLVTIRGGIKFLRLAMLEGLVAGSILFVTWLLKAKRVST